MKELFFFIMYMLLLYTVCFMIESMDFIKTGLQKIIVLILILIVISMFLFMVTVTIKFNVFSS